MGKKFILIFGLMLFGAVNNESILTFEIHHDRFIRDLFGCPPTGIISDKTCLRSNARLNYEEFEAARKAAKRLYSIDECLTTTNSR